MESAKKLLVNANLSEHKWESEIVSKQWRRKKHNDDNKNRMIRYKNFLANCNFSRIRENWISRFDVLI